MGTLSETRGGDFRGSRTKREEGLGGGRKEFPRGTPRWEQEETPQEREETLEEQKKTPQEREGTPEEQKTAPQEREGTPEKQKTTAQEREGTPEEQKETPQEQKETLQEENRDPETSIRRQDPGGSWLNKVRSLLQGQGKHCLLYKAPGGGGEAEGRTAGGHA
ncbi:hypothetical protein NDU88_007676 [Pleurodeles waltl]|uniref:Uncharacterized protein n=1 Tax=Pleurodeles waltl TaxID=8319 RepID=A0AAV7U279_PLEWA|nr:hypothetical protein NDU88_007676 [Pleurodeles waltl]